MLLSTSPLIQKQLKAAVGIMTLLGTGWIIGVFMYLPNPDFQIGMQYVFIILNSTQVCIGNLNVI